MTGWFWRSRRLWWARRLHLFLGIVWRPYYDVRMSVGDAWGVASTMEPRP